MIIEYGDFVLRDGKKTVEIKGELSPVEFKIVNEVYGHISRFSGIDSLFNIVLDNCEDLSKYISAITNKDHKEEKKDNAHRHIERTLINYLSSAKMFLDHTETKLKQYYGSKSENYLEWKKIVSKEYDNNFEYRFLYQLRNYTQHMGIHFSNTIHTQKLGSREQIRTFLERDVLLNSGFNWKKLEAELKEQPSELSIVSLVNSYNKSLMLIYIASLKAIAKDFADVSFSYFDLLKNKEVNGQPFIIKYKDKAEYLRYIESMKKGVVPNITINPLPSDTLIDILKTFENFNLIKINFIKEDR